MSETPSRYASERELKSLFEELGDVLQQPADAFLIGGGAMTLRGIKDSTKDIDLVTADRDSFRRIEAALLDLDFSVDSEVGRDYEALGATTVLKRGEEGHIDLFDRQVATKLSFSDRMVSRADEFLVADELTVETCSPVDIVLFKSMTPRPDDPQDARTVITAQYDRFDWDVLREEFEAQLPLNTGRREHEWIEEENSHPVIQFEQTIRDLDGVPASVEELARETARVVEAEGFVALTLKFEGETERSQLVASVVKGHPSDEETVREAIDRLASKEVIDTADGVCSPDWSESV